ncbi:MAG: lysophospholipid acyltransferase family protein [Acidobacteriota bacterium]
MLIRLLRLSLRVRHIGREVLDDLDARGQNYILAFWHGRLLMMPYAYRRSKMNILISRHRDGEYIARTMGWFGHRSIRGSTTHGGSMALREVVRTLRQGLDVGITPDGPKGPRHRVQMGVIQAARLGGVPIVPVSFSASRGKVFRSWDRFLLPMPFSTVSIFYGEPVIVPPDTDEGEMRAARERLETILRELVERGDRQSGRRPARGSC